MSLVLNAIIVSIAMIFIFFLFFLLVFIIAITLSPIEKSISKAIWDATAPPKPATAQSKGSFKDFSKKH